MTQKTSFEVGVKALIPQLRGNDWHYLFLVRKQIFEDENQPRIDLPGGRMEVNDTDPQSGLVREVRQETGLTVVRGGEDEPAVLEVQKIPRQPNKLDVIRITNLAKVAIGPVVLSDEHSGYMYLTRSAALESNLDPYVRALLAQENKFAFERVLSDLSVLEMQGLMLARRDAN